jgi:hypothetical protein
MMRKVVLATGVVGLYYTPTANEGSGQGQFSTT